MKGLEGQCKKIIYDQLCVAKIMLVMIIVLQYMLHFDTNDFWWHIRMGEWMIQHGEVPFSAIGCWYANENGISWFAHEWLSEVIIYICTEFFGIQLIRVFFCCLTISLVYVFIQYNKSLIKEHYHFSLIYLLIGVMILPSHIYGRPQSFMFILLGILMYLLYDYYKIGSKKIMFLPVLSVVWANIHGGSANLIYILPSVLVLGQLIPIERVGLAGRMENIVMNRRKIVKLAGITIVALLCQLLNPHGVELLLYPYINAADSLMLHSIVEWAPASLASSSHIITVFLPLFFCLGTFLLTSKKIDIVDFFFFSLFFLLSLRSIRFSGMFFIVSNFYIYKYLPQSVSQMKTDSMHRRAIFLFFCLLVFMTSVVFAQQKGISGYMVPEITPQMADYVRQTAPKHLYNNYNLGAELIYYRIPVFIDGRADAYTKYQFSDALSMENLTNDPDILVKKYKFDYILLNTNTVLYWYLKKYHQCYTLLYEDSKVALFKVEI